VAEHPTRKLAVILHADVVGSTVLVRRNETLAHERIKDVFKRFSKTIVSYSGIAHELRGDALVAEFSRASDAIAASLAFQTENTQFNSKLEDDIQPHLRIGIAMGEVVVADNTVTGEGVVLAQRLEQLAELGGVCIQGAAYETVPKRLPFEYDSLGEQKVKGFEELVRVYTVTLKARKDIPPPDSVVRGEKLALELPDKPSIAVLPFTNMSADPEQEYFSDGITEDIITELTKFHSLSVIARNSSFSFKGRTVKVQEVAHDLGVQYVVEGSVRKAGNRVRITAQLIEALTGDHVWAQRYDRQLEDIFAVQDDVSQTIVATIAGRLDEAAARRAKHKPPENMTAYDCFLRGLHQYNTHEERSLMEARQFFQEAVDLDANYARAHAYLALTIFTLAFYVHTDADDLDEALAVAEKAVALDNDEPFAYAAVGLVMFMQERDSKGIANLRRSITLNPHDPELAHWLGFILTYAGELEEGIEWLRTALRLNPRHSNGHTALGIALYLAKLYDEAIDVLKADPGLKQRWTLCYLAAANAQLGRSDEAHAAAQEFVAKMQTEIRERGEPVPTSGLEIVQIETAFFRRQSDAEHFLDGMRGAGLE
jgi:adenylate cyclase